MSSNDGPHRRLGRAIRTAVLCMAAALATAAAPLAGQTSGRAQQQRIDPELMQAIRESREGRADAIVHLTAQADLSGADAVRGWERRGQYVVDTLQKVARNTQRPLLALLAVQARAGQARGYTPYYIINAVFVRGGTRQAFEAIARVPGVRFVEKNKLFPLPDSAVRRVERVQGAVAWGVAKIGAPQAWSAGATGQGIVVGNIDTGVNASHPALLPRYRGTSTGSHDYNWYDPTGTFPTAPGDTHNHGTHTMGTMVGDDGTGNQIGVAPGARWIAARGCGNSACAQGHLISAGQWMLAPTNLAGNNPNPAMRPRVINNSWYSCASAAVWYQGVVKAWRAADIFPAFIAGNNCATIGSPGSLPESFASGATDVNDVIAPFSAHGPSPLTTLTKPEVTAPGVDIYSSLASGNYGLMDGTSMASPHTAGCAALILSSNPSLPAYHVERLLAYTSVDLGAGGPDMTYGVGRINCASAVDWAKKPWWQYQWGSGTGQFGLWNMNAGDKFVVGDFDDDDQDELLAVSVNGWSHLMQYTGSNWQWMWGTGPNGKIALWNLNPGDKFVAGDYDGDGRDELLAVSTNGWSHLMRYTGSAWQFMWGTGPAGQIASWNLNPGDRFVSGDFDQDGRDELLAVSTNGWSHLMKFTGSGWQYLWGTGPNGQIGTWNLNAGDRFFPADYDGDGRDELLAISTNGWSHRLKFTGSGWQYLWGTGPNGQIGLWNLNPGDRFAAGDYDGDGSDDLVSFANNGWSHLTRWSGSGWQWLWGNAGASQIALWNMNVPDQFFAGNFDASSPRDELFALKMPWTHLMKYEF